jgi:peptidoglycan/LPS O-acetylase OafA/YrhL
LLEAFKGLGCLLIVVHHLAFYGPMADVVAQAWPRLMSWLDAHGRLAVQVFLVCGGYLTANSLAKLGTLSPLQCCRLGLKRYLRLAVPLLAALSLTVVVTELLRPIFDHDSLSPPPELGQALAHVFLLQHVWGMDGLSAGVWYVAVDVQLFMSAVLLCRSADGLNGGGTSWSLSPGGGGTVTPSWTTGTCISWGLTAWVAWRMPPGRAITVRCTWVPCCSCVPWLGSWSPAGKW